MVVPSPEPDSPEVVYQHMRWNTPLSEAHADLLLDRLGVEGKDQIADLGCGWGQLLIRAVAKSPMCQGVGVDTAQWALARGRAEAIELGVSDRVVFTADDASAWSKPADRVICVGASHAWGGTVQALQSLSDLVRPGGRILFGDGYWHQPPTSAATEMFGEDIVPLSTLANEALRAGWRILHLSTADQREWDEFESTWRAGREQWSLSNPDDPRTHEVRAKLDQRLSEYLTVYRGVLGFVYLVLAR
jgi:SAM-dependent methyltransferase